MRPIDAVTLSEGIELHRKATDQEYETDRQWAVGFNAGLDRALYIIAYAKTITPPPNEPLTIDELREMDGEPVWVVQISESPFFHDAWMIVTDYGAIDLKQSMTFCEYGKTWLAYRRKPEEA